MKLMEARVMKCDDEMVVFDDLGSSSNSPDIAPYGQIFPTPYAFFPLPHYNLDERPLDYYCLHCL